MKTKNLILALIVSLLNSAVVFASSPVGSPKSGNLTEMQRATLEYAKRIIEEQKNEILLPVELFSIVGDFTQRKSPKATLMWDKATFKESADWKCILAIPLKTQTSLGVINSNLYIRTNDKEQFQRIVITALPTKEYLAMKKDGNINNSQYSGYSINSNIEGVFLRAFYYDNGEQVYQIEGVMGNVGVSDPTYVPYNSRYRHNKPDYVQPSIPSLNEAQKRLKQERAARIKK